MMGNLSTSTGIPNEKINSNMKVFACLILLPFMLLLLPFLCACPLDEDYEDLCWNNFRCFASVPKGDSVWIELYAKDSLLETDKPFSPTFSSLPGVKHEFRDTLILRIHVFCNGVWLDSRDYEFVNRKDKYTQVDYDYFDLWKTGSPGVQVFDEKQLEKCPELSEYHIYEDTEHGFDCPQFH
ncbi:hypothetical protein [uncultured Fibrobacter sp.]|uniref:hypothetical protein n=1 Tax=uncultured Fibrobacter sp. TaxID=261512 RepID=UPI0025D7988F|nr:hypothetical protein [uncultured Fibrobacter sp.]